MEWYNIESLREKKKKEQQESLYNLAAGVENSQGSEIPSVLQIQRQIATAEGRDHDFSAEAKGTESAPLSEHKKHNY